MRLLVHHITGTSESGYSDSARYRLDTERFGRDPVDRVLKTLFEQASALELGLTMRVVRSALETLDSIVDADANQVFARLPYEEPDLGSYDGEIHFYLDET